MNEERNLAQYLAVALRYAIDWLDAIQLDVGAGRVVQAMPAGAPARVIMRELVAREERRRLT